MIVFGYLFLAGACCEVCSVFVPLRKFYVDFSQKIWKTQKLFRTLPP